MLGRRGVLGLLAGAGPATLAACASRATSGGTTTPSGGAAATTGGNAVVTSQLALPEEICDDVYATDGYGTSVATMARTSLADDNVFSDGWSTQLATVTGSVADGLTATLTVGVGS